MFDVLREVLDSVLLESLFKAIVNNGHIATRSNGEKVEINDIVIVQYESNLGPRPAPVVYILPDRTQKDTYHLLELEEEPNGDLSASATAHMSVTYTENFSAHLRFKRTPVWAYVFNITTVQGHLNTLNLSFADMLNNSSWTVEY